MTGLPEKHVVTCFVECRGKILLLKRSQEVGSFRGRWAGVSGYVENSADEQSLIEISEETGLGSNNLLLVKKGLPIEVDDLETNIRWIIHPYLYRTDSQNLVKTDWEHCDLRWIRPEELGGFNTVPMLQETFTSVFEPRQP